MCTPDLVPYLIPVCQYEEVQASLEPEPAQVHIERKKKKIVAPPTDTVALLSRSKPGSLPTQREGRTEI